MDSKGSSAEISYPNIFFILDNFEEVRFFSVCPLKMISALLSELKFDKILSCIHYLHVSL